MDHFFNLLGIETSETLIVKNSHGVLCTRGPMRSFKHFLFDGKPFGEVASSREGEEASELIEQIAPLVILTEKGYDFEFSVAMLDWVYGAKELIPDIADWIGIYYKANIFWKEDTTDLILGPYYGESTNHQRIPLDKGLCGLALREERVVNVKDVHKDERHIACSLKTNSELIVPLKDESGNMVAELDIDCNQLGAFTEEVEKKVRDYCETFAKNVLSKLGPSANA